MNQNFGKSFPQNPIKELEKLDEVNKSTAEVGKIDVNQLLMVTLSTTVMLAKKKPVDIGCYTWMKIYLQNIRDDEGKKLQNISGILNEVNEFEKKNNILDELQGEVITDDFEGLEIPVIEVEEATEDENEAVFMNNIRASSTQITDSSPPGDKNRDDGSLKIKDSAQFPSLPTVDN